MFEKVFKYFTKREWLIWIGSILIISIFFFANKDKNWIVYIASLIGASALIFTAKANPVSNLLFVAFSILYAYNSYITSYFGEVFNFLCINMVLAIISYISWIKNLNKSNKSETTINNLSKKNIVLSLIISIFVTFVMFFVLKYLGTSNLIISTLSVGTNFFASTLMIQRCSYFSIVYAFNDIIVIILWSIASMEDISNLPNIIYFIITFINDIYIFFNWKKIKEKQNRT